mmetsp:Transcript_26831/g.58699  ORF Transcript_26831/g.58699 Transcript_26831/m.58699 type:complete len:213 (+) Transcript_26831:106-744(+)
MTIMITPRPYRPFSILGLLHVAAVLLLSAFRHDSSTSTSTRSTLGIFPLVTVAHAFHHGGPDPMITPQTSPSTVVQSQLSALQADDLRATFQYASPQNRAVTGPTWERFSAMVRTPNYVDLIRHSRSEIVMTVSTPDDTRWRCLVQVWPKDRPGSCPKEYWWALSRCKGSTRSSGAGVKDDGANNDLVGCYMVDAVVPNKKLGEIELRPGES